MGFTIPFLGGMMAGGANIASGCKACLSSALACGEVLERYVVIWILMWYESQLVNS